ncbi:MAG: acyl carrier protein [Thermoleophilaceae bacterium]
MTGTELRAAMLESLAEIAPEADVEHIDENADLREQLDIDSFDFLNVIIALHERTGIDVPERDYPKLTTLSGCVSYLSAVEAG